MPYRRMFALFALFAACLVPVSAQDSASPVVISLERTACFGACPIYTLQIHEDGTVVYDGTRFVDQLGRQESTLRPETVTAMLEAIDAAGFFEWDENYTEMTVTDLPSVVMSATRSGETHTITRYAGDSSAPLALPYLEMWIDRVVGSARWTGTEDDFTQSPAFGVEPVLTLERTPCFGFCPVYAIAAYADGAVVYTGISDADYFGVREFQVEPLEVEFVASFAETIGYFDWQDEYTDMYITDAPYHISSVRLEDQYKRIERYGADYSVPYGVIAIEDQIDRLTESEMAG